MLRLTVIGVVLILAVSVALAGPAGKLGPTVVHSAPAPSLLGPTGAILTPTADTVGDGRWNVGYHFFTSKDGYVDFNTVKANIGLGPAAEVGLMYLDRDLPVWDEFSDSDDLIGNFKLRIWDETDTDPAVAIGVIDVSNEVDLTAYVVVQKTFLGSTSLPITLTAGYGSGEEEMHHFFGSGVFHVLTQLDLIAELDHEDLNYGARWWPCRNVNIDVGALDTELYAGVAYRGSY